MKKHTETKHPEISYIPEPATPMDTILLRLIVSTDMSFNMIENSDFQTLISAAGCSVTNRHALRRKTGEFSLKIREKLKSRLLAVENKITDVAITLDGWKSPNFIPFFGITVICLSENWDLEEFVLCLVDTRTWDTTNGRLPSDCITDCIRDTLQEYGIARLLRAIVADGGSDVIRGVNLYNDEQYLWCTDHIISLAIQNMLSHSSIHELVKKCKAYARLMKQGSVLRKMLKQSTIQEVLLNEQGENYPAHIEQQVATRWLSAGRMIMTVARNIRRIHFVLSRSRTPELYDQLRFPAHDQQDDPDDPLDESDMMTLLQLEAVFTRINESVLELESRKYGTVADLFPTVLDLQYRFKTSMRKSEDSETPTERPVTRRDWEQGRFDHFDLETMTTLGIPERNLYWKPERRFMAMNRRVRAAIGTFLDGISDRFERTDQDTRVFIATLLNPTQIRFACFLNLHGEDQRTQLLEDTKENLRDAFVEWKRRNEMQSPVRQPPWRYQRGRTSNASMEHETSDDEDADPERDAENHGELTRYLSRDPVSTVGFPGVLEWWKSHEDTYPKLSAFARQYLVIPSTSASIERTWSAGRDIVGHRRFSLAATTISELLFIKKNKSLSVDMDTRAVVEPESDDE